MRLTGSQNVGLLHFGLKCSKSRRFLELRPRPRWESLRRSTRPPSREGLLAFGNRSFAPSALNRPLAAQTKIPAPLVLQTQNPRTVTGQNFYFFIANSVNF